MPLKQMRVCFKGIAFYSTKFPKFRHIGKDGRIIKRKNNYLPKCRQQFDDKILICRRADKKMTKK